MPGYIEFSSLEAIKYATVQGLTKCKLQFVIKVFRIRFYEIIDSVHTYQMQFLFESWPNIPECLERLLRFIFILIHEMLVLIILMAEGVGFEPTVACTTTVFKTVTLNRSVTPPQPL